MARVVILGGGFGGLAAANELRGLLDAGDEITLVDRSDRFFMGFAKLWDLARARPLGEGTAPLARLEGRGVRYVQADITGIDPAGRTVATSAGTLEADALIVALGAPGAPAHLDLLAGPRAHDLYDAAQLPAIHGALDALDGGRVLVAILGGPLKCPPAPYEAALIVDERLRARGVRDAVTVTVSTFQPATLPVAGPDASRFVATHLADRGVELLTGQVVEAVGDDGTVRFRDGSELACALVLGVPACAPPPVIRSSALAAPSGWIEPDRHTLRTAFDRVYAIGDCTTVPTATAQLPKAGVFAAAEGRVAARNVAADLRGGPAASFDGHGTCYLELPGDRVALVTGNFYAEPAPDVRIDGPSEDHFRAKQAYERDGLAAWLG